MKPNTQQVARAGEHFVVAEINRRGAYAVPFAGNMPHVDILASDIDQIRTVAIQVKTKRVGTWHSRTTRGRPRKADAAEARFWIFVDLGTDPGSPTYYVVPEWWVENSIHVEHQAYLARHGGQSPRTTEHHGIPVSRIAEWRDRWDLLGIFETE